MSICEPSQNPPNLPGTVPWASTGKPLTPEMQHFAAELAYSDKPIGYWEKRPIAGSLVLARVLCHTYTVNADQSETPGRFHGATLFDVVDASKLPDQVEQRGTDWALVGACGVGIAVTTAAFLFAIKKTGIAAQARHAAAERPRGRSHR